jgi:hypothetical protein
MTQQLMQTPARPRTRHFVPLDKLPDPFIVPDDLQTRFRYDAAKRGLTFDGYMCKGTFDRLRDISLDFAYQRALEDLFRKAVPEDVLAEHRGHIRVLVGVLAAVAVVLVVGAKLAGYW